MTWKDGQLSPTSRSERKWSRRKAQNVDPASVRLVVLCKGRRLFQVLDGEPPVLVGNFFSGATLALVGEHLALYQGSDGGPPLDPPFLLHETHLADGRPVEPIPPVVGCMAHPDGHLLDAPALRLAIATAGSVQRPPRIDVSEVAAPGQTK